MIKEEETATEKYAKFIADPFETGYGHTVGNAFRRVLLSSIEGAAISSLKMDGVQHEFQSVDGVVEDITDIVLNLKKVLIINHKSEPAVITLDVEKEGEITAGDISPVEGIEIINPEQVIIQTIASKRFLQKWMLQLVVDFVWVKIASRIINRLA